MVTIIIMLKDAGVLVGLHLDRRWWLPKSKWARSWAGLVWVECPDQRRGWSMASILHCSDYTWATAFSLGNDVLSETRTNQRPERKRKKKGRLLETQLDSGFGNVLLENWRKNMTTDVHLLCNVLHQRQKTKKHGQESEGGSYEANRQKHFLLTWTVLTYMTRETRNEAPTTRQLNKTMPSVKCLEISVSDGKMNSYVTLLRSLSNLRS